MNSIDFKTKYVNARRAVIKSCFSGLNDMQCDGVLATEGPLLLLAGAGSGKTTVVINRIANLIRFGRASDSNEIPADVGEKQLELLESYLKNRDSVDWKTVEALCKLDPCEPWRIIAITFTNKAADELKARLGKMLGDAANDIWAKTFHSACVRILRRDADLLGFGKNFTIYDTTDSAALVKRITRELDIDDTVYKPKTSLSEISKAKDALISPEQYIQQAEAAHDFRRGNIGKIFFAYEKRKLKSNAMDFDDLLYYTVKLLEEHESVRKYYQNYFKYVLIDEYQDTNYLQYRIAYLLAGERNNICVVGDDDQSIYKFRGATIENILNFERQFKNARTIRLEQNYRSTKNILNAANEVIRNNDERKGKELWTESESGDKLTVYFAQNENDEAQYVASKVLENFSLGTNWRENVVLYRMNAQSNKLEYAFKRNGVPYRIVGGMRFFERAEIKDILSYMCLLNNSNDEARFLRVVNTPARAIGEKTIGSLREIANRENRSLFEVAKDAETYGTMPRGAANLRMFASLIDSLRDAAGTMPLDELFDLILDKTGYMAMLEKDNSDENIGRIENIGELRSNIVGYMTETGDNGLAGFLDEVALYTDLDALDKDADAVVMMTMHTAKGLEFDNVYLVGFEEGIFPSDRSSGSLSDLEEERRLCYVAITRARKKLTICCARARMIFGITSSSKPSRFLREIPEDYLEKTGLRDYSSSSCVDNNSSISSGYNDQRQQRSAITPPPIRKPAEIPGFKADDRIHHKAFGDGTIVKMTPMGGDFLIEVQFEAGIKKLMLRAAAPNMEHI